jgi:hypothetical protein
VTCRRTASAVVLDRSLRRPLPASSLVDIGGIVTGGNEGRIKFAAPAHCYAWRARSVEMRKGISALSVRDACTRNCLCVMPGKDKK